MARKDKQMKIIVNNSSFNLETLTYGELKAAMPTTKDRKLPTEKQLRDEEPLFIVTTEDSQINVYRTGHIAHLMHDENGKIRATIYGVDRCDHITYEFGSSKEEYENVDKETGLWVFGSCKVAYSIKNGQLVRYHIVPETEYIDKLWILPISLICEEHQIKNAVNRSASKIKFYLEDEEWNAIENNLAVKGPEELMIEAEEEREAEEKKQRDCATLKEALASLTEVQRRTVQLYYYSEGSMTEEKVGEILGTSQQAVHKNLVAAMKKLRKFF